jgi:hypothetical protein
MLTKCFCTNCAGHLEFEEENSGEKIKCPHCGFDTTLFVPGNALSDDGGDTAKIRGPLSRRAFIISATVVLVLGAVGYALYRWVLPPLKDWLPYTDSVVLPLLVLGAGCLALLFLVAWAAMPFLILFQLRRLADVLADIELNLRPDAIIKEDATEELGMKQTEGLESIASASELRA